MRSLLFSILCVSAVSMSTTACLVETHSSPAPPPDQVVTDGTFVLRWSINRVTDPNQCSQAVASGIDINVYSTSGARAGTYQQSCSAFSTSISLAPGSYTADAALVDGAGNPRTTRVPIDGFTIRGNDTLDIDIDFPASSFF